MFSLCPAAGIIGLTILYVASGRPIFWDDWVKRTAAQIHTVGIGLVALISVWWWGISAVMGAWPLWGGFYLSRKLSEIGLDLLAKVGLLPPSPKTLPPPRTIYHPSNGTWAVVNGQDKGYQRIAGGDNGQGRVDGGISAHGADSRAGGVSGHYDLDRQSPQWMDGRADTPHPRDEPPR